MKTIQSKILFGIALNLLLTTLLFRGSLGAATFKLDDPGTEQVVNYSRYGTFTGVGTGDYSYRTTDYKSLQKAVGVGIYPNSESIYEELGYKANEAAGALNGSQWDFVNTDNHQLNFYKWASVHENPGVKLYFTALALEKAGHIIHALKAYYAIVVHFPKSFGITYWGTPWYVGPVSIGRINYILDNNPELGIRLIDAKISMSNQFDNSIKNDTYNFINPGKLVRIKQVEVEDDSLDEMDGLIAEKKIGKGNVKLIRYSNNHWQMQVDGKPFVIRGMNYFPNKVGISPAATKSGKAVDILHEWMSEDSNGNGIIDAPFESWVDKNGNNIQDENEKAVGDFQLMKDMGVNTIRLYDHEGLNKDLLLEAHKKYGFMFLMGDLLGMYCVGSGAEESKGTDYTDAQQRKSMLERVKKMVKMYRDEPYILMWVLGNENNYGGIDKSKDKNSLGCDIRSNPELYYSFVNKAAKTIKSLDPQKRPVAICNGDTLFLDICSAKIKNIDVFGVNSYRGEEGFSSLWQDIKAVCKKPVLITEFGCSSYHSKWDKKRAEEGQAKYLVGNWKNIEKNMAGSGHGNALGGCVFEWVDEWWKAGGDTDNKVHDTKPQFGMPFLDGYSYEEWLGVCSQGDGSKSPFMRQLRPSYYKLKELWKEK